MSVLKRSHGPFDSEQLERDASLKSDGNGIRWRIEEFETGQGGKRGERKTCSGDT